MTAAEIIDALCEAQALVGVYPDAPEIEARRDRIKAAVVRWMKRRPSISMDGCPCDHCKDWRALEEAVRGE